MAQIRDVMAKRLQTVGPDDTVGEAVAVMAQNRIGSVLIMDGERLLGIFTERDTVRALSQAHDAARHEIVDDAQPHDGGSGRGCRRRAADNARQRLSPPTRR